MGRFRSGGYFVVGLEWDVCYKGSVINIYGWVCWWFWEGLSVGWVGRFIGDGSSYGVGFFLWFGFFVLVDEE